jgi:hypothetical protein
MFESVPLTPTLRMRAELILAEWKEYQEPALDEDTGLPCPLRTARRQQDIRSNWPHRVAEPFDLETATTVDESPHEKKLKQSYGRAESALTRISIPLTVSSSRAQRRQRKQRLQALRYYARGRMVKAAAKALYDRPEEFLEAWLVEIEKIVERRKG